MKNKGFAALAVIIIICCSFAPGEWLSVSNKAGRFKMNFPMRPTESEQTVQSDLGDLKMKIFMCDMSQVQDENQVYGALYCDYPAQFITSNASQPKLDTFFENAVGGGVKNIKGSLISQQKIKLGAYPGRNVKMSFADGQGIMYMRVYLVKNRLYFLEVACEKKKEGNASVEKFFKSFALLQ